MKVGFLISGLTAMETIDAARQAELRGHDGLWIVEDLWQRGAVPLATACACATERLRVGVGVVIPYTRHPTLLAMDYGVLAELSQGRIIIGIGAGVEAWINQMGIEYKLPRTGVKEAIAITRDLLSGGECNYQGKAFRIDRVKLGFDVDHAPPLYMGAMADQSVRTCGEVADGWVISLLEPLGYVQHAMTLLREGAEHAGRDVREIEVVQYFPFSCDPQSRRAKDAVKPLMAVYLVGEFRLLEQQKPVLHSLQDFLTTFTPGEYRRILEELEAGGDPVETIPDEFVDELAIAGTPEECARALRRYADAGVTEAALLPVGKDYERAARIIGEEVRPLVQLAS